MVQVDEDVRYVGSCYAERSAVWQKRKSRADKSGDQRETSSCRHQHLYGLIVALESGIRHAIDLTIICSNDDVAAIDTSIGQSGIRRDCHSHRRAAARWD